MFPKEYDILAEELKESLAYTVKNVLCFSAGVAAFKGSNCLAASCDSSHLLSMRDLVSKVRLIFYLINVKDESRSSNMYGYTEEDKTPRVKYSVKSRKGSIWRKSMANNYWCYGEVKQNAGLLSLGGKPSLCG